MESVKHTTNHQKEMVMKKFMVCFVILFVLCVGVLAQQVVYSSEGLEGTKRTYYDRTTQTIYISDDVVLKPIAVWGNCEGIDSFGWTMGHEKKHHNQFMAFWPNGEYDPNKDYDGDWIPDDMEETYMPGRPYDPYLKYSYLDEIGYGENPILDREDICMRSQIPVIVGTTTNYPLDILWINGSADHLDWSSPGKQTKGEE